MKTFCSEVHSTIWEQLLLDYAFLSRGYIQKFEDSGLRELLCTACEH